jgi:hypothetical protein
VKFVELPKAAAIPLRLLDEDALVSFAAEVFQRALRIIDRRLLT